MLLIHTYNPSYALYEVREATTLELVLTTPYLFEAEYVCNLGEVPEKACIVH